MIAFSNIISGDSRLPSQPRAFSYPLEFVSTIASECKKAMCTFLLDSSSRKPASNCILLDKLLVCIDSDFAKGKLKGCNWSYSCLDCLEEWVLLKF